MSGLRRYVWMPLCAVLLLPALVADADPLKARYQQGAIHGFLVVRDDAGKLIGTGDVSNVRVGKAWKERMTLRFRDGSIDDETAVYMQNTTIHLLSDHHVQKGPSFPKPMDMTIDTGKNTVTWHEFKDGKDEVKTDTMDLPADVGNGLLPLIVQNLPKGTPELKMGYVVATPKPRIVKLAIQPDGQNPFTVGGARREAAKYRVHVELGGIAGVVAPIIGKEPPDLYISVVEGEVPTFLRLNGPLFEGGPLWSIDLSSPTWPTGSAR